MSFWDDCPGQVYQKVMTISTADTDGGECLHSAGLLRISGDSTVEHMEQQGLIENCLKPRHLLWMIGWSVAEIKRLPRMDEQIIVRNWPGAKKNGMYPRHCGLYSMEGEELAAVCTLWLLVDEETRRMSEDEDALAAAEPVSMPGELKKPKLAVSFPEEYPFMQEHTVVAEEIDRNGHCNNARYLEWIPPLLSEEYRASHICQNIWIQYVRELLEGQTVRLNYAMEQDILFVRGICEGEECFSLRAAFQII